MKLSATVRASYEFLGLEPQERRPSLSELKKAYHRMALLYHPDRNPDPGAATEFARVTEAYELLCDEPRVIELNRQALKERLHRVVVEGLEITFGSFFGYRLFETSLFDDEGDDGETPLLDAHRSAHEASSVPNDESKSKSKSKSKRRRKSGSSVELENASILDNPAYDAIEVVYAGRLKAEDEHELKGKLDDKTLIRLPWVVLNNQGILRFLEGDLRGAMKCYRELCERVPNNIIFTYRLGVCHILDGFKNPRRTFLGRKKPDALKVEKGIELLKHCIKIGETRTVGRQKCLVIRKVLADVYERMGRSRQARALWKDIHRDDPSSLEAVFHAKGRKAAERIWRIRVKAKFNRLEMSTKLLGPGSRF